MQLFLLLLLSQLGWVIKTLKTNTYQTGKTTFSCHQSQEWSSKTVKTC